MINKRHFSQKSRINLLTIAVFAVLFLLTRLINIDTFPSNSDEGRHVLRAYATVAHGDIFIGLRESLKQFHVWVLALILPFFQNGLLAGRLLSVGCGLAGTYVCYQLTKLFFPEHRIGYLAAWFYLVSPMALFYDRLAMTESMLGLLIGISLILSVHLWRRASYNWAVALGLVWSAATLTKAYAIFFYPAPILLWLFWGRKISWAKLSKLLLVAYGTTLLAWLPIVIIGYDAYWGDHVYKLHTVSTTQKSWFQIQQAISGIAEWLGSYLTIPLVTVLLISTIIILIRRDKSGLVLLTLTTIPIVIFSLILAIRPSRYLFPLIVPLSILSAYGIHELSIFLKRYLSVMSGRFSMIPTHFLASLLFLLLSWPAMRASYLIITAPPNAPLPAWDQWVYIKGRYSGYGLKESAALIQQLAQEHAQVILLKGADQRDTIFSVDVTNMSVYLFRFDNIDYYTLADLELTTLDKMNQLAQHAPVIAVGTFDRQDPEQFTFRYVFEHPQAELLATFIKPGGAYEVKVFRWLPPPQVN